MRAVPQCVCVCVHVCKCVRRHRRILRCVCSKCVHVLLCVQTDWNVRMSKKAERTANPIRRLVDKIKQS